MLIRVMQVMRFNKEEIKTTQSPEAMAMSWTKQCK